MRVAQPAAERVAVDHHRDDRRVEPARVQLGADRVEGLGQVAHQVVVKTSTDGRGSDARSAGQPSRASGSTRGARAGRAPRRARAARRRAARRRTRRAHRGGRGQSSASTRTSFAVRQTAYRRSSRRTSLGWSVSPVARASSRSTKRAPPSVEIHARSRVAVPSNARQTIATRVPALATSAARPRRPAARGPRPTACRRPRAARSGPRRRRRARRTRPRASRRRRRARGPGRGAGRRRSASRRAARAHRRGRRRLDRPEPRERVVAHVAVEHVAPHRGEGAVGRRRERDAAAFAARVGELGVGREAAAAVARDGAVDRGARVVGAPPRGGGRRACGLGVALVDPHHVQPPLRVEGDRLESWVITCRSRCTVNGAPKVRPPSSERAIRISPV